MAIGLDIGWLNALKRDWEPGESTISKTISFSSMSKDIQVVFPDLKLPETCIQCKNKQLKKCPYLNK